MALSPHQQEFGRWLRRIRTERGLTQEGLARRAGLSPQHYNKIETGTTGTRQSTVQRLAVALDADVDEARRQAGIEVGVGQNRSSDSSPAESSSEPGLEGENSIASGASDFTGEIDNAARRLADLLAVDFRQKASELVEEFAARISLSTFKLAKECLEERVSDLRIRASVDSLTGLNNRVAFEQTLHGEFARAHRYGIPLSLLLFEVDKFVDYNLAEGYVQSNMLLKNLAQTIQEQARRTDIVARLGGDEFAIILPHTDEAATTVLARRYRAGIKRAPWNTSGITVSGGFAVTTPQMPDQDALLFNAMTALRQASNDGGDTTVFHQEQKMEAKTTEPDIVEAISRT